MSLHLSILTPTGTEGFMFGVIHPPGKGVDLEKPRNTHDLQIFLGMMVYFSSYIPFYAWIAVPLFNLLRKDTRWEWTDLHTEAFELCKQVLTNAPVRGYATPGSPY